MKPSNSSCAVAVPRERNNATAAENATSNATARVPKARKPASLQELRAQLRAQLTRNQSINAKSTNSAPIVGAGDAATGSTTPADARIGKVLAKLHGDPGLRYAAEVHIDAAPDAVILTLAIRDKAACELHIPRAKYDSFLLLELIERHSGTVQ